MPKATDRVGMISSAQTQLRPAWDGLQHVDLIADASNRALLGSGLTMADVGVVIDYVSKAAELLRVGMPVKAVWRTLDDRNGTLNDIEYFEPIAETESA